MRLTRLATCLVPILLALASPALAQETIEPETIEPVDPSELVNEGEELGVWHEIANVLTAPFRFLGSVFYYTFKFLFHDVWVALFEWIFGSGEVGDALEDLESPDARVRQAAARRLGELGDREAVDGLVRALADRVPDVRRAAALALAALGGERAVEAIRGALVDPDLGVRGTAALALGRAGGPSDVPRLVAMLELEENRVWYVESSVVTAIGALGGSGEIPLLRERLERRAEGDEWVVVASAAHALGRLGDRASRPRLVELLGSDVQIVRSAAAEALGQLGALEELRRAAALEKEPGVVRAALLALGGHGSPADGALVARYARHPDSTVVVAALTALGFLRDPRAIDEAIRHVEGDNTYLRLAAAELLARWTGEAFGPNPGRWKEWWAEEREDFEFVATGREER